jgi:hypothetical protein
LRARDDPHHVMAERQPEADGGVGANPEQERFLRSFVRRHALAGPVGALAAALGLGALLLASLPRGVEIAQVPTTEQAPTSDDGAVSELHDGLDELRREITSARRASASGEEEGVEALARRVDAIARELATVRRRLEARRPTPSPSAAPPSPAELGSALERLYQLELRQERQEASRDQTERDLLGRVHALEARQAERERQQLAAAESVRERLHELEVARDAAETQQRASRNTILERLAALETPGGAAPASPAR